jgi:hypothetical protein
MLMDVLLSSPKVSISTMQLMLVQTSDEDKRPVRSEAMATVKVFSLVFLMLREEEGLEFTREAPLTLA